MVARRSPPKLRKMVAPINPLLLRETLTKVDRCMSRLQELQYTVSGGTKVISGVNLSPRSTRGYLRTSLRCKQESLRIKNATPKKSPVGKFPANTGADWRRMSLPAMLLGETIGEIIQASQFAREIVEAEDPKTPVTQTRRKPDNTELRTRRKREKQNALQSIRPEPSASPRRLQRVRSRINFKVSSPPNPKKMGSDKESSSYGANRVSPKLKPWAKKAVLFPNPLFLNTPSKTKLVRRESPHKFLIKSPQPPSGSSRFQVRIKSPAKVASVARPDAAAKVGGAVSVASKLRRSFSPSRLASRLVSPLKSRKSVQRFGNGNNGDGMVALSGLKQRPALVSMRHSTCGDGGRRN